jgi:hypothetical protein
VQLPAGETGVYSVTIQPLDASAPVSLLWSNEDTSPETTYSWDVTGTYTVEISASNCEDAAVVTDTLVVEVVEPCYALAGATIDGSASLVVGEPGLYSILLDPPNASQPIEILWSNGITGTQATYTWNLIGSYVVSAEATNCGGTEVAPPFDVAVLPMQQWLPLLVRRVSSPKNGLQIPIQPQFLFWGGSKNFLVA